MRAPTGKLAFAYRTIAALEAKCDALQQRCAELEVDLAEQAAEQPECVTCSGHGLVGNRLDDGEECPECHGAGIICGTECGACAEQTDTVAVPRDLLEELADIADAMQCHDARDDAIALLAGGEA